MRLNQGEPVRSRVLTKSALSVLLSVFYLLSGCGGGGGGSDGDGDRQPVPTFALRGTIQAPSGTAIDGDVNDPFAPFSGNDAPGEAQEIPNPVTVGGYVNVPLAGPGGRSFAGGDLVDYYRVSLGAGQSVDLFMDGDGRTDDLDLFLLTPSGEPALDPDGEPILSVGETPFESVSAFVGGTYLLLVEAFAGASKYVLVVGQSTVTASKAPEYVPGEVIVRFRDFDAFSVDRSAAKADGLGLTEGAGAPGREMLLRLGPAEQRNAMFRALEVPGPLVAQATDPEVQLRLDTRRTVKALRRRSDVAFADLNYIRLPNLVPSDTFFSLQWHYPQINLPQAWDHVPATSEVAAAVLDTGVVLDHPELRDQILRDGSTVVGYDFISSPILAGDGDGIDPNPEDPGDGAAPEGSFFHGTHVAGTVAARTGNALGVAGVAWNAKIMPLRVLTAAGGTDFDIIQALRFAAGLENDSGATPPRPADVVNMSFGGPGFSQAFQNTVRQVREQGLILVAAAGNEASDAPSYPAAYDGVISVGAVGINKELAPYSNFGSTVDATAPGGNSLFDVNGDGHPDGVLSTGAISDEDALRFVYVFSQGTSMAAPHVAGVAALMRSVNPALTPQELDAALASGAITEDLGAEGRDNVFGHGLIDAFRAVTEAVRLGGAAPLPEEPSLAINPGALNFGSVATVASLAAGNAGGGTLRVDAPTDTADWLTVTGTSVGSDGLGTYRVAVDRTGLLASTYTATITFTSSANTVLVPVIMQVPEPVAAMEGDAGFHYVVLVEATTGETVNTFPVGADRGTYVYEFPEVPAGSYLIVAGTDSNNDGFICDPGEACGAFRTLDQPEVLTVDGDRSGLDFVTGFASNLQTAATAPGTGAARRGFLRSRPKGN